MKHFFRHLFLISSIFICFLLLPCAKAEATGIVDSGTCGENLTWELDDEGLLTIRGTGEMKSYNMPNSEYGNVAPWSTTETPVKKVQICDGVTVIGSRAFANCDKVEQLFISDSVTTIQDQAFWGCAGLTSVTIPRSVKAIEFYAFWGCKNLTDLQISEGVESIGVHAFDNCPSLTRIVIPDSVVTIKENAFYYCIGLKEYVVSESNPNYQSLSGVLFNKDGTVLIDYPTNRGGSYEIPDGVTDICSLAFANCSVLSEITIPDSVQNIGAEAFAYMGSGLLEEISIPNEVKKIEEKLFQGSWCLRDISLPSSIEMIADSAFLGCSKLTNVFYGGSADAWASIEIRDNNTPLGNARMWYLEEKTAAFHGFSSDTMDDTGDPCWRVAFYCADGEQITVIAARYEQTGRFLNSEKLIPESGIVNTFYFPDNNDEIICVFALKNDGFIPACAASSSASP